MKIALTSRRTQSGTTGTVGKNEFCPGHAMPSVKKVVRLDVTYCVGENKQTNQAKSDKTGKTDKCALLGVN